MLGTLDARVSFAPPTRTRTLCAAVVAALAAALLALALAPAAAWADEAQGDDAPDWAPAVTVSANQDGLPAGQVRIEAAGTNDNIVAVDAADLSLTLPEGLSLVEGQASAHADALEPGATLTLQAVVAASPDAGAAASGNGTALAKTGDAAWPVALAAAILAAAVVVVLAYRRWRRAGAQALSVVLVLALAAGLAPAVPSAAHADEAASGSDTAAAETTTAANTASTTVALGGRDFAVSASFAVALPAGASEQAEAELTTETYVAVGATSSHVSLTSSEPLAQHVDASAVTLDAGLAGYAVTEAERVSDTRLDLVIARTEGGEAASEDAGDGLVLIDASAFAADVAQGVGIVAVVAADAVLEEADTSAGQGPQADGTFVLPISLGSGEFAGAPDATAFTVPASADVQVTAVSYEPGARSATVTLAAPGATPQERFDALDAALTAGGIRIAASATNCGEVTAASDDVERGEAYGYETTALEYADATLTAAVGIVGVRDLDGADGGAAEVTCEAKVATVDGGEVDLRRTGAGNISIVNALAADGDASDHACVQVGGIEVTGADTLRFTLAVDDEAAQVAWELVTDGNGDGRLVDDLEADADLFDYTLSAYEVTVAGGGIANQWGVALDAATASLAYVSDVQDEPAALANSVNGVAGASARTASNAASSSALTDVLKQFQTAKDVLSAIGQFSKLFKAGGNPFAAVGSVLGISAGDSGTSPSPYTTEDVVKRLDSMQESIKSIENEVRSLSTQLEKIQARNEYLKSVNTMLEITSVLNEGLPDLVKGVTDKVDLSSASDVMSSDDQGRMRALAASTAVHSRLNNHTTYGLTTKLGTYLLGEPALSAKSVCDLYYAYVETYYNWDSETFEAKQRFLTYVGTAYAYGYIASMCELNVAIADAQSEGDRAGLEQSQKDLVAQAGRVVKLLIGTQGEDGTVTEESALAAGAKARSDGKIRNLVVNDVFLPGDCTVEYGFNQSSYIKGSSAEAALQDCNAAIFGTYAVRTRITEDSFKEMISRLGALAESPSYSGPKTIAAELEANGFSYGKSNVFYRASKNLSFRSAAFLESRSSGDERYQFVIATNYRRIKVSETRLTGQYRFSGDVLDIRNGKIIRGVTLATVDTSTDARKIRRTAQFTVYDYKAVGADQSQTA